MTPSKPPKTAADVMVIALSPALIMVLVGSLCFFLIEVFCRGTTVPVVRWVMFWFVLAATLISRIAIEESTERAALYGLALAGAVCFYLAHTVSAYWLGLLLLSVVWFSAHKLVWDCTLIDEDEDSSGQGLLESRTPNKEATEPKTMATTAPQTAQGLHRSAPAKKTDPKAKKKRKRASSSSPGLWVVYFSLAALPLFGIGQPLLPSDATDSRRMSTILVVLYMTAALGLLLTTSFLGLRRYLRQRYLKMPGTVALAWLKLGVGAACAILAAALLLPRPGSNQVWTALRGQIDYRLQQASQYAAKSNRPGQGQGQPGNTSGGQQGQAPTPSQQQTSGPSAPSQSGAAPSPSAPPPVSNLTGAAASLYKLLRAAVLVLAALFAVWWLIRCRFLLLEIARSIVTAIANFFRDFMHMGPLKLPKRTEPAAPAAKVRPLAEFKNPFFAGEEHRMPPEQIILYTYDAARSWAREQGHEPHPDQTAREFCQEMAERSPEFADDYRHLSFLYAHAAYGKGLPNPCDLGPLKEMWRQFTFEQSQAKAGR
jgi:hypothetical protein